MVTTRRTDGCPPGVSRPPNPLRAGAGALGGHDAPPAERRVVTTRRATGRWDGDTLVVTTTDIDFPWFDQEGIPQSDNLRLVERFSVSDDDRYLLYSVTATDSAVFTAPVVLEKRWLSVPGEELQQYSCSWESDHL